MQDKYNIKNLNVGVKQKMRFKSKEDKGITLIALVITIIVMLILVGVTINIAMQGGLFDTGRGAAKDTQIQVDKETLQGAVVAAYNVETGEIESAQKILDNLPKLWTVDRTGSYICTSPNENVFIVDIKGNIKIPIEVPNGWNQGAIEDIVTETVDGKEYKVPIPVGYVTSKATGEKTVAGGLVIYEGTEEVNDRNVEEARTTRNQFVWIPVEADFVNPYGNSEPKKLTSTDSTSGAQYDSQDTLNYYYGTKEDGNTPFYDYATDFAYSTHYAEMIQSVNKYKGFYIGRYETTIDETSQIGSKGNTTVLTAGKSIPQTNNKACRWWGLYNVQRNSNVVGNKEYIQTNMICGQQWEAMLKFLGNEQATSKIEGSQSDVLKSGEATYENGLKDIMNNMYDLRRNGFDWTAEAHSSDGRVARGGNYNYSYSASSRGSSNPTYTFCSSRLTLYIK